MKHHSHSQIKDLCMIGEEDKMAIHLVTLAWQAKLVRGCMQNAKFSNVLQEMICLDRV